MSRTGKPNCRSCYYRNTVFIGDVEVSTACDHPEFLPEGKNLTLTEFQAPDWCPLGVAQPLKRDAFIDLPENPTIRENSGLKRALVEWTTRGNMDHKDTPSDLECAFDHSVRYFRKLKTALSDPDVAFVLLNPKDYTDHVMLNMTKETYELETRRESLIIGLVGSYLGEKGLGPYKTIYVRREIGRGQIILGKEKDNPLEVPVPRDFERIEPTKTQNPYAEAANKYREDFDRIAESGFDHARKAAHERQFQESNFIVTDRSAIYPENYVASDVEFIEEILPRVEAVMKNPCVEVGLPTEAFEATPKMCPVCAAPTQTTPLTPPDEGVAFGCTRCTWPSALDDR